MRIANRRRRASNLVEMDSAIVELAHGLPSSDRTHVNTWHHDSLLAYGISEEESATTKGNRIFRVDLDDAQGGDGHIVCEADKGHARDQALRTLCLGWPCTIDSDHPYPLHLPKGLRRRRMPASVALTA